MNELGFGGNGLGDVRIDLSLIAGRGGAGISVAKIREQEFVVPCPHRTIDATPGCRNKLRVSLVEGSEFQDEKNVRLNPEVQAANGKQDALRLLPSRAPVLFEAGRECLFLLGGLELRQQEGMPDADLLAVEGFDHHGNKLGQSQTSGNVGRVLTGPGGDLLDGVYRLLQAKKRTEALRLLHRVNVAPHEVFHQLSLQRLCVGKLDDADGNGCGLGDLRGAITPRPGNDLEAVFG